MTETCQKPLVRLRGKPLRRDRLVKKRAPLGRGARAGTLRNDELFLRVAKRRAGGYPLRRRRTHRQPAGRRRDSCVLRRVESLEERGESRLLRVINAPLILGWTCERSVIRYGHKHFPGARSTLDRASDVPRFVTPAGRPQLGVCHRVSWTLPKIAARNRRFQSTIRVRCLTDLKATVPPNFVPLRVSPSADAFPAMAHGLPLPFA
jgi:hypothetical protein